MNWFVHSGSSEEIQRELNRGASCCEHVDADPKLAISMTAECDSFGREWHISCAECAARAEKEEEEAVVVCHDCKKSFPRKEVREWEWYDFYAPQGDEPLVVCHVCWKAPRHQERLKQDKEDEAWELGSQEEEEGPWAG